MPTRAIGVSGPDELVPRHPADQPAHLQHAERGHHLRGGQAGLADQLVDRHGAVVVPIDKIDAMKTALDGLAAREAKIIAAAKAGGGVAAIKAAMKS